MNAAVDGGGDASSSLSVYVHFLLFVVCVHSSTWLSLFYLTHFILSPLVCLNMQNITATNKQDQTAAAASVQ